MNVETDPMKVASSRLQEMQQQFTEAGMNVYLAGMTDMLGVMKNHIDAFKQRVQAMRAGATAPVQANGTAKALPQPKPGEKIAPHPLLTANGPMPDRLGEYYTRAGMLKALRLSEAGADRALQAAGLGTALYTRRPHHPTKMALYLISEIDALAAARPEHKVRKRIERPLTVVPVAVEPTPSQAEALKKAIHQAAGRKSWMNVSKAVQRRKVKAMADGRRRAQALRAQALKERVS